MEYATRQLGALAVRQRADRADAYVATAQLISAITPDGASPTPQIGDNGEGGIATEWLVNGRSLVIDYADPLQIFISAVDSDGARLFDADITFSWHADDDIIARSRELLAEMAIEINAPISLA